MYVKLFASIYQGTLRGNADGLLVFTNLLSHADQDGIVDVHPRVVADEVGISLARVQKAIDMLEAADPESRTKTEEGRRLLRMDDHRSWGWQITNYAKYRAVRNADDRREQNRLAAQRYRARQQAATEGNVSNNDDASSASSKPAHAEAEAEAFFNTTRGREKTAQKKGRRQPATAQTVDKSLAGGVIAAQAVHKSRGRKDPALLKIELDELRAAPLPEATANYLRRLKGE